ncbi:Glycosyltransferase [uncultured Desulfobacterium sp.]|uniref:Glycosyltransferase n=1 Tax=uncultured Desulfobacterium sp. TaxID=201089 RepID=A0A445MSL7_9BACT|nr:Glycosyltransferase [uncultured Desulfobacterium sp.]
MEPIQSDICVIIAAYNAAGTISRVVKGALKYVPMVIVADDGSIDETARFAAEAGARVISIPKNRGKGNALKILFKEAIERGFHAAISIDADCQHDTEDIPLFISAHRARPDDLISGSRTLTAANMPRARYNAMQVARFYISLAANQFIDDTQCGFRLYPLKLIKSLKLVTEGYITEAEILIKAGDMGVNISTITIRAIYNTYKSHFRALGDGIAIGIYLAYFLIIKWLIEGVRSNHPNTYAPNGFHDLIGKNIISCAVSHAFAVLTIVPLSLFFLIEYLFLPAIIKNNFASVRSLNVSFAVITLATLMAPVLMIMSLTDKIIKEIGFELRLVDRFIEVFYPHRR